MVCRKKKKSLREAVLVSTAEKEIEKAIECARRYQILPSSDNDFECISEISTNIVNIQLRTCTCKIWQQSGIPCAHATGALLFKRQNVRMFVQEFFKIEAYRQCYQNAIYPVPDKSQWIDDIDIEYEDEIEVENENEDEEEYYIETETENDNDPRESVINQCILLPPNTLRPPGRPKKRRIRTEDIGRIKRTFKCSRCSGIGHSRRSCREPIS